MGTPPGQVLPEALSDSALGFVQQCQVAVLSCAHDDYVAEVIAIWKCLAAFPRSARDDDLAAAVIAVSRVASGFFGGSARRELPHNQKSAFRRCHANALLRFALEHYAASDLTLIQAAPELGLSVAFLSRALSAETGHSFRRAFRHHLNGIRILAAIERMRTTSAPLSTIAREVGYPRTGELDRQFDRWFQLSPRAFRAVLRRSPGTKLERC